MSPPRYWTVEEAQEALPRVAKMLESLQREASLATRVRSNGHANLGAVHGEPEGKRMSDPPSGESDPPAGIQPVLEELERAGIILRDPARGLIDFPAMHLGRVVHLCWQLGEDDLAWWHFPDAGFAGRRPLPLPDEF